MQSAGGECRQLVPLLASRDVSLLVGRRLCTGCVRGCVLHGSGAWPLRREAGGRVGAAASWDGSSWVDVWRWGSRRVRGWWVGGETGSG